MNTHSCEQRHGAWARSILGALLVALFVIHNPLRTVTAATDGAPDTGSLDPVDVLGSGLQAATDVTLEGWGTLAAGEELVAGDRVGDGTILNESSDAVWVRVGADFFQLAPGQALTAIGPGTPARRCACKCGTVWRVFNYNAGNCAQNPPVQYGAKCVEPGTGQLATWTECTEVFDVVTQVSSVAVEPEEP